MHPHRMSNFLSFRSLFETREQRLHRSANSYAMDSLKVGNETLLNWHQARERDLETTNSAEQQEQTAPSSLSD